MANGGGVIGIVLRNKTMRTCQYSSESGRGYLSPALESVAFSGRDAFGAGVVGALGRVIVGCRASARLAIRRRSFLRTMSLPMLGVVSAAVDSNVTPRASTCTDIVTSSLVASCLVRSLTVVGTSVRAGNGSPGSLSDLCTTVSRTDGALSRSQVRTLRALSTRRSIVHDVVSVRGHVRKDFSSRAHTGLLFSNGRWKVLSYKGYAFFRRKRQRGGYLVPLLLFLVPVVKQPYSMSLPFLRYLSLRLSSF